MKKILLSFLLLSFTFTSIFAQTNKEKFFNLYNNDNVEEAKKFLEQWKKEDKKDPELYICYFNMYINESATEQMQISTSLPNNYDSQYMVGTNDDGNQIFLYSIIVYDDKLSKKAFDAIDTGIKYNPNRLDMYLGKAQFYFVRKEYKKQYDLLKKVLELNKKNKDAWLWSNNVSLDDAKVKIEDSFHEYFIKWYNESDEATYTIMKDISLLVIEQYPENAIAYNDAGISFILLEDYEKAKEYLQKGYDIDPTDMILVANLARVYYILDDKESSKKYYQIMSKSKNKEDRDYAKEILKNYF